MAMNIEPILLDIPDHFETQRLLIRTPFPGDGLRLHEAALESQPELRQWMPWAVDLSDPTSMESYVRKKHAQFLAREDFHLLLFLKESDTLIGGGGLHPRDWDVPKFEIGYWLRTAYQKHGYATEAVKGIAAYGLRELGAGRLEIQCDARNEPSAAVARRAGFEFEGRQRNEARHHLTGELRDTLVFALIREDG